jgi:hypothetical protein
MNVTWYEPLLSFAVTLIHQNYMRVLRGPIASIHNLVLMNMERAVGPLFFMGRPSWAASQGWYGTGFGPESLDSPVGNQHLF